MTSFADSIDISGDESSKKDEELKINETVDSSDNLDAEKPAEDTKNGEQEASDQPISDKTLAIDEDHAFVEDCLPPAAIFTQTYDFVTVLIIRTAYARVQLRVQYGAEYPNEAPIVELSSPTLPLPLLRNKEKECSDKAREYLGKPQFHAIYDHIYKFIHGNLFIPCWKEMKQVGTLSEGKGSLKVDEKEGVIRLRLTCGQYKQLISLKVPYDYPEQGAVIEFGASNYPADIQLMFKSQAEEIVRRCEAGYTADQAVQQLTSQQQILQQQKAGESKGSSIAVAKMTTTGLKSLKHDVNVLKQMSDLRAATTSHHGKMYKTEANEARREARKDLRRLARAESEADREAQQQYLEEEQQLMNDLLRCKVSETAQPSLLPVAKFLVEDFAFRIPVEPCQACRLPVLPADPESEAVKNPRSEKRAMRTFCGHWLHWNCLNDWLCSPPFVRQCPTCSPSRRIWHPDWPEDYKQLEKAWQSKEARKREMSDVSSNCAVCINYIFADIIFVCDVIV